MEWISQFELTSVLVVEDDPVAGMLLQRVFKKHGVQVDFADTMESALAKHQATPYRLIVSDWILPGRSGVELCQEIRKSGGEYVYFILCTSRGQRTDRLAAFEAGVDDFFAKPIDQEELEARISVACRIIHSNRLLETKTGELEELATRLSDANFNLDFASKRFEELFNGLPVACFTLDSAGHIKEWNRCAAESFGYSAVEVLEQPVWEVFDTKDAHVLSSEVIERLFAGEEIAPFDWRFSAGKQEARYYGGHLMCLRSPTGNPIAAMCANIDVTERVAARARIERYAEALNDQKRELERMNERLGHLAVTDGLTGLWNHRRFQEMLEDTIQLHRSRGIPFSLALADIDHFKGINDDFGHQHGDQVLRQFADTLRETARLGELSSRYGGEEFAMLLQGCGKKEAMLAVQRYQRALKGKDWAHRGVTASFGVVTYTGETMSGHEMVKNADAALYASKHAGRDRATHFEDMLESDIRCA